MRTETRKILKFSELSEEVQKKVIEKNQYVNTEYDFWFEDEIGNFVCAAKEIGFNIEQKEVFFSLDRDSKFGIYRDGISVNDEHVKKTLKLRKKPYVDIEFRVNQIGYYRTEFPTMGWHTSTENSEGWYEIHIEDSSSKKKIKEFIDKAIEELVALCDTYYDYLNKSYEYSMTDEAVKETIECNEWEFTNEGERINS